MLFSQLSKPRTIFAICVVLACSSLAAAERAWMSEEAMRAEFVGKKLRGYFHYGTGWTSTHHEGGRFETCEGPLCVEGRWFFRGRAFCDLRGLQELCAVAKKISANCYEFHMTSPLAGPLLDKGNFQPKPRWHSRGWRQEEPSTCEERPSAEVKFSVLLL